MLSACNFAHDLVRKPVPTFRDHAFAGGDVSSDSVRLSEEQRLDWLRLIRSDNVGPRGIMAQTPQEI